MSTLGNETGAGGKQNPVTHRILRNALADMAGSGLLEELDYAVVGGDIVIQPFIAKTQSYTSPQNSLPNVWSHPGGTIANALIPDDSVTIISGRNNGTFTYANSYDPYLWDRIPILVTIKEGGVLTGVSSLDLSSVNLSDKVHGMMHVLKGIKEPSELRTRTPFRIEIDSKNGVSLLSAKGKVGGLLDGLSNFSVNFATFNYCDNTALIGGATDTINPNIWQGGVVANNRFTIQRVYAIPYGTNTLARIQVGAAEYNTKEEACAAILTESFTAYPPLREYGILYGYIVVQEGTVDWTDDSRYCLYSTDQLGNPILPSASGGGSDLDWRDIATGTSPTNNTDPIERIGDAILGTNGITPDAKLDVRGEAIGYNFKHRLINEVLGLSGMTGLTYPPVDGTPSSYPIQNYELVVASSGARLPAMLNDAAHIGGYFWLKNLDTSTEPFLIRDSADTTTLFSIDVGSELLVVWDGTKWVDYFGDNTPSVVKYPYDEIEITPEGGSHQIVEGDNPYLFVYEATETYGNPEASVFLPDTSGWTSDNDGCFFEIKNWSYTKSININAFGASFGYPLRAEHSVRMIWTLANGWYEYDYNKEFAWSSDESSNPRDGMNLRRTGDVLIGSLTKNKVSKLEVNGDITGDSYNHTNITRFTGTGITLDESSTPVLYFNPTIPGANVNLTDPSTWTTRDTTDAYFWIYNDSSTNGFDILDGGANLIFLSPGESVIVRWDNVDWRAWSKTSTKDADWFVPLSTIPPSDIADNMFTQGNVAIGEDKIADANLEVRNDVLASGYRWKWVNNQILNATSPIYNLQSVLGIGGANRQIQILRPSIAGCKVTLPAVNSAATDGLAFWIKNEGTFALGIERADLGQAFTDLAIGESAFYVLQQATGTWFEYFRSTGGGADADFVDEATSGEPNDTDRITRTGEASAARFINKYYNTETFVGSPQILSLPFDVATPRSYPYQEITVTQKTFLALPSFFTNVEGTFVYIKNSENSTNEIEVQTEFGFTRAILQPGDSSKFVRTDSGDWQAYNTYLGSSGALPPLTQDHAWIGDATNTATETPVIAMLSGQVTLGAGGTATIVNPNITATSRVLLTATNSANLLGGTLFTNPPAAGLVVVGCTNSGATGAINYLIV